MTSNLVTIEAQFEGAPGQFAQGHFLFWASGTHMSSGEIAIVTPIHQGNLSLTDGTLVDSVTQAAPQLLATDNYSLGELYWNCNVQVAALPMIQVLDFPVNFALGATQNLFDILQATGWSPAST